MAELNINSFIYIQFVPTYTVNGPLEARQLNTNQKCGSREATLSIKSPRKMNRINCDFYVNQKSSLISYKKYFLFEMICIFFIFDLCMGYIFVLFPPLKCFLKLRHVHNTYVDSLQLYRKAPLTC